MEITNEYAYVEDIAELDALRILMRGFSSLARSNPEIPADTLTAIDNTVEIIGREQIKDTYAIQETDDNTTIEVHRFSEPYTDIIIVAIATIRYLPTAIERHLSPAEFYNVQIFFPPEPIKEK